MDNNIYSKLKRIQRNDKEELQNEMMMANHKKMRGKGGSSLTKGSDKRMLHISHPMVDMAIVLWEGDRRW